MDSQIQNIEKIINADSIKETYKIIRAQLSYTDLKFSLPLSSLSKANVYIKEEQLQHTGSFKLRGVLSKIESLGNIDSEKIFVAASTGNHAAAFAHVLETKKRKGVLFLPKNISKAKLEALKGYSVTLHFFGENSVEAEAKATAYAKEINGILIHPYNDVEIIKGQATIGLEIEAQLPNVDAVLVPVGGGGLASGIASFFQNKRKVSVIGCQPYHASEMYDSIQNGNIVNPSTKHTIADASAGGIEDHAITFELCKKYLSGFELLTEKQIKSAVAFMVKYHNTVIEPTAALPIAALLNSTDYQGKNIVLVTTGRKIESLMLKEILDKYDYNY